MYREAQRSFVELAESLSDADWAANVPCTPAWTVRDVLSHVCGVTDDVANGRVDGAATDPWTASQVVRWKHACVNEMIDRWNGQIDQVADVLETIGERRPPIDCHSHEHDVRHALGRPEHRDSELIVATFEVFVDGWANGWTGRPLTITFDDGTAVSLDGVGAPNELRDVSRFDVVRARLGRRSRQQVAEWSWREPPTEVELDAWFAFGPSELPIHE